MTLAADEFIRRFLIHVLPSGFHRIRHYGWIANTTRVEKLAQARALLQVDPAPSGKASEEPHEAHGYTWVCPSCAAPMIVLETFGHGYEPRAPPAGHVP